MPLSDLAKGSPINALLRPTSIAIAGASSDPGKLGSLPLTFLQKYGYGGEIYPINPKGGDINGLRSYTRMAEIQNEIDLLVIAVGAAHIPELLRECAPGQVKAAVVLSSGYAELGADGVRLQHELRTQAENKGIRFIGPNSVGLANLWDKVIPSISQVYDQPDLKPGPIAFVSQSGAMGTAVTALSHAEKLGIGYFVSTGNEGDLEFSDFCAHFADDPSVNTIAGYVEGVRNGRKFIQAVRRATGAGKPVILLKVGTTEVGGSAVRSHTGALAGEEEVYEAVFRENGVVRAQSLEQLVDYLKIFSSRREVAPSSRAHTPRVAVLSHSGGAGVLIADTCIQEKLSVPKPSHTLTARLASQLPAYASLKNPIDMTASVIFDPGKMTSIVKDAAQGDEFDAVILCVNLIWRQGRQLAEHLVTEARDLRKLLAITWIASKQDPIDHLNAHGVPVFPDPVRCAKAVAARLRWERDRHVLAIAPEPRAECVRQATSQTLRTYIGQTELFERYGIPLVPAALTSDLSTARQAANDLGYPVVAKLIASDLPHKSDRGGVILNIQSEQALEEAFCALSSIPVLERQGVLVQRMASGRCELFAGARRDAVFGPIVVFGLGGIYVEVLKASSTWLGPLSETQARKAIEGTKFYPLLAGARGQAALDIDAIAAIVSRLSYLAADQSEIHSIDLNPILASSEGAIVVDAKVEIGTTGVFEYHASEC